jgi:hypothetical protein
MLKPTRAVAADEDVHVDPVAEFTGESLLTASGMRWHVVHDLQYEA